MDPPPSAGDVENHGTAHSQYLAVSGRPSAASSLRRMFTDSAVGSGSGGMRTPATPDERTSLLGDSMARDLEEGGSTKKAFIGALVLCGEGLPTLT